MRKARVAKTRSSAKKTKTGGTKKSSVTVKKARAGRTTKAKRATATAPKPKKATRSRTAAEPRTSSAAPKPVEADAEAAAEAEDTATTPAAAPSDPAGVPCATPSPQAPPSDSGVGMAATVASLDVSKLEEEEDAAIALLHGDPWATVTEGTQDTKLAEDDIDVVVSIEDATRANEDVLDAMDSLKGVTGEASAVLLSIADAGFTSLNGTLPGAISQLTVSMDASNNMIEQLPPTNTFPHLRKLSLQGNPIACPLFHSVPLLRELDLSFCDSLEFGELVLAPLKKLRVLRIDCCGLTTLDGPALRSVSGSLVQLHAGENDIDELEELAVLASLPGLQLLDLRENPCCDEGGYTNRIKQLAPNLLQLDNRILKVGQLKSVSEICGLQAKMVAADTVADHNEDRGSCSCLEGNACATRYTCKDWDHRFEIAAKVRRENMHPSRMLKH